MGLLDTTGWVDLAMIPTKDHKLPWIPNASPDTCRVLHAPCIALISCDWSSTKIASLFVPAVIMLANPKEMTSFVHEDRKDYILLDRIPETDMAPQKLLVRRLVSFWGRHLFRWRSAREDRYLASSGRMPRDKINLSITSLLEPRGKYTVAVSVKMEKL